MNTSEVIDVTLKKDKLISMLKSELDRTRNLLGRARNEFKIVVPLKEYEVKDSICFELVKIDKDIYVIEATELSLIRPLQFDYQRILKLMEDV